VSAVVVKNCTITTAPVAFGNYDSVAANATTPLDGLGTVTVACTKGRPPR
jgi:spore coat protein U-like protein